MTGAVRGRREWSSLSATEHCECRLPRQFSQSVGHDSSQQAVTAGLAGWERAHLLLGGQLGHTEHSAVRPFEMPAVRVVAHA